MMTLLVIAAVLAADVDDDVTALKAREPSIESVQAAALQNFGVNPDRISGMRSAAAWKAAIPTLEVSGGATGANIDDTTVLDEYDPTKPWVTRGAKGSALEVRTTLAWDLPRIAFNPEELDVAGLAGVQKDIIVRVTQVYFARRRAQLALISAPSKDPLKRMNQEMRVEELGAVLSGLTGGWFATELANKTKEAAAAKKPMSPTTSLGTSGRVTLTREASSHSDATLRASAVAP
ncbi:MAG: hypothetical protein Q8O67_22810 [Deltaproteobacteria bacterium]|nr:hypothetical protein [Deltaproteobacteria bacterium]